MKYDKSSWHAKLAQAIVGIGLGKSGEKIWGSSQLSRNNFLCKLFSAISKANEIVKIQKRFFAL